MSTTVQDTQARETKASDPKAFQAYPLLREMPYLHGTAFAHVCNSIEASHQQARVASMLAAAQLLGKALNDPYAPTSFSVSDVYKRCLASLRSEVSISVYYTQILTAIADNRLQQAFDDVHAQLMRLKYQPTKIEALGSISTD